MVLRSLWAVLAIFPLLSNVDAREISPHLEPRDGTIAPLPRALEDDSLSRPMSRQFLANGRVILGLGGERGIFVTQSDGPFQRSSGREASGESAAPTGAGSPPMQGLVTFLAGGAEFEECISGMAYPILTDGDFAALEHAYLAAGIESGVSILASFDGEIVEVTFEDADAEEAVRVERFVGVWPEMSCERAMSEVSLTNTYWKIVSLFEQEVSIPADGKEPHMILLAEESRFTATAGCNQFMGSYSLSGTRIHFGPGAASTQMACQPELQKWESLFREMISEAEFWEITDGELGFLDSKGNEIAAFHSISLN